MSEKILSCFFQTMYFGVLIGLSCLHGKKKKQKTRKILFTLDLFHQCTPMLQNLKRKTTQFSFSQLLRLFFNRFWQKLLLFLHTFFFLFNFWYINNILVFPFAILLAKPYLTPKPGFACYCCDNLKSLPLFYYLNSLISSKDPERKLHSTFFRSNQICSCE